MSKNISVVIPVYKKTDMFVENLIHNLPLLPKKSEIIIVDDASQEYLYEKLRHLTKMKHIHLIENEKNLGFSQAINKGIMAAKHNYVMLLNSDVRLTHSFPDDALTVFEKNNHIAAISFAERDDGMLLGKSVLKFSRGLVAHDRAKDTKEGLTAWANGGSCICRIDRLKELGAFDVMYSPFYWEDIDLSYRMYSRGWHVLYYPRIVVEHARESTISTYFSPKNVKHIAYRNQFLFTWANITDIQLFLKHILWLPIHLLLMSIRGETEFVSSFFWALQYVPSILKRRSVKLRHQKISDKEIFKLFS